ncbi:helix-turn-helix transcriptional regulator [Ferrimonas aestuarii]|uniref:Helix-turn-helix transcriptional regulator n=1 Tax=Ferrimonas aestuarii TaxID=2569539 RepID=A0A4U1BM34_9GAMM|nr:helix-turn-helix transcriptional regulator [Ferrimonas aestuarii]TKB53360.1 helix-turn-helix transcriptional regulator [Ferrimonas aestuarii]
MTLLISEDLRNLICEELAPLQLTNFYFALLPANFDQAKAFNSKFKRVAKLRSVLASSKPVFYYRDFYHRRLSHHDDHLKVYRRASPQKQFRLWPAKALAPKMRPILAQQLDRLNANSRFRIVLQINQELLLFFHGFSALDESKLQTAIDHFSRLDTFVHLSFRISHIYRQPLSPMTNFAIISPLSVKVLKLAAYGFSSQEIASQLHLSERGVNYHIDRSRELLGAKNRIHLISLAHRQGII